MTTAAGIPGGDNQHAPTAGPRGPLLVQDWPRFETPAHGSRERLPERVVHAKGAGAYGPRTVTPDLTPDSQAKVFSTVGKTPHGFVRFSTGAGERGAADAERDGRGLAGMLDPAFGLRSPMRAAAAMTFGSASVIAKALRLRKLAL